MANRDSTRDYARPFARQDVLRVRTLSRTRGALIGLAAGAGPRLLIQLRNRPLRLEVPGHLGNAGEVQRRGRLGGMLNYYYRAAA